MDAEISFGDFQQSTPQSGVAPDRNPHYAVAWVGEPVEAWPIFVDLDVMRELESHALENVNVELGGVLLGDQMVDGDGRPFVVVRDSLRAEHYEATRGSFKFTHQTWEAITRKREQFPDKFSIVGWYHTHPGWGVFLSDMDLFICNHFFNGSLDVALVIDPIRDDRGWFAWSGETSPATKRRSASFGLFGHRHRGEELEAVARHYNERANMSADPRLRMSKSISSPAPITMPDRSMPTSIMFGLAVLILGQLMLMTAVLWRGASSTAAARSDTSERTQIELLVSERQAQTRVDVYRELLKSIIEKTPETAGWVDRLTAAEEHNRALQINLEGQTALAQQLKEQQQNATQQLARLSMENKEAIARLGEREKMVKDLQVRLDASTPKTAGGAGGLSAQTQTIPIGIGVLVLGIGCSVGGYIWGRRHESAASATFSSERDDRSMPPDDSKIKLA